MACESFHFMKTEERMYRRLAVLGAIVILAGCSSSMDEGMAVTVTASVSPAGNATGVSRSTVITMDAGMPMDTALCAERMLLHLGDSAGPLVPGTVTWEDGNRRMVFRPDAPLAPNTAYFVHVRDSMMTTGGMTDGMMGGGGMMGSSDMHSMMMQPPTGAMRMGDGMGWIFTTGS